LGAVMLGGLVMFHMHADLEVLAVASAAALASVVAALVVAELIARRIGSLAGAAEELAAGELKARAPTSGPRELAELGRAFNEMAAGVERLFDARRQLVAWASHDLRTPLASIQAMLEAIEDGLVPAEQYLPELRNQARALGRLVDDLFELAAIDAGALTLELRETPLGAVVESCVRGLQAEAAARMVRLEARVDGDPPVRCAPDQVERVLLNLLTNALRHTPSDGSVVVAARPAGPELEISVEDTGEGIEPGDEARMFDRFWRADRARTRSGGGAGLGLAIARGLVEAQGGRIWAERRSEGGARISFTLPLADRAGG
ncbi:MAG: HAMP domain-containing histidine kinase, partial [Actinobacteria bacterium]|nr:HAMP domain-containing histidine kinase [Actinomycetota bacterium]